MPSDPDPGRIVQVKITKFRSISDCDRLVWSRSCSKQWDTELSTIKSCSETSNRPDDEKSKLQSPERCCRTVISYQESKKETWPVLTGKCESLFHWKAHGQCSKVDSCSFSHDPQALGNKGKGQRRKGRFSSPASHSKAKRTDGEEQKSSHRSCNKQENSRDKNEIPCRFKFCKNSSCGFCHPVCLNYISEKGCVNDDKCHFRHFEADGKPNNKLKKVVRKDQLP